MLFEYHALLISANSHLSMITIHSRPRQTYDTDRRTDRRTSWQ